MSFKHTSRQDPTCVTIKRTEYDGLLRESREYHALKSALYSGGITPDTLCLLIAGSMPPEEQKIDTFGPEAWADEFDDGLPTRLHPEPPTLNRHASYSSAPWKSGASAPFHSDSAIGGFHNGARQHFSASKQPPFNNVSASQRHASYGGPAFSIVDGTEADSFMDEGNDIEETPAGPEQPLRTLYFTGFGTRTTYRDLLSVIKGGKLLTVSMRSEKSATVTFLDAASDYLAWVKRNDIYLHGKRVEVRWAERQFTLNSHIQNKIDTGATRNILIRNAAEKGLTEARIRDDLEHIHNLVVIDVKFRDGNAYVYTNAVHNALFARTCMMSRTTYRGCKISFFPDECDVPLPTRAIAPKVAPKGPTVKNVTLNNRFDMLDVDDQSSSDRSSNEENRTPRRSSSFDNDEDDDAIGLTTRHGVSLQFLECDSNA
ncbi:hypothetical protein CKM354_000194100 [Cercospora kikuchii]|uniref:RRM domain-containing protein n=1 Tax=Cercospora kikuchii TaxID=84275 RepID=A0A9P3CDQ6_9PEZI|nr:uncharacterized protein CKM354_000194100 [Cercospora kikuchii]GIZ38525.1 hypothetical protein CKM354_000194100 [Cercospora kikuchii]